MTYLELINQFWQKDLEYAFTSTEVDVYFRLLDRCNKLGWKSPFNLAIEKLMSQMGLRTKKPLDTARKKLREAGLLEFKNGNGRGFTTEYTIIGVGGTLHEAPERGNKNIPLSGPLLGTLSGTLSGGVSGLLHKKKIKNKKTDTGPSPEGESVSEIDSSFSDFWQAYGKKVDKHKCEQRWRKLTPAERVAALAAVPAYVANTPDQKYRKNPLTWLNGCCWQDEPAAAQPAAPGKPAHFKPDDLFRRKEPPTHTDEELAQRLGDKATPGLIQALRGLVGRLSSDEVNWDFVIEQAVRIDQELQQRLNGHATPPADTTPTPQ